MEKLTKRMDHGVIMAPGYDFGIDPDDYDLVQEILCRLAAYEDTGLEPEQIVDMVESAETRLLTWFESRYGFPVGELMGLLEAKQEGRQLVLPCAVGATVWANIETAYRRPVECEVIRIDIDKRHTVVVFEPKAFRGREYGVPAGAFGKTVFLSYEEANADLKRGTTK